MNAEQAVAAALRVAADVESDPRALDAITAGIARRRARARLLVPVTAAAVVLSLVGGIAVFDARREAGTLFEPARRPRDLYVEQGSVWPFQSRAAAEAWRGDRSTAPYLATAEATVREFARVHLGGSRSVRPFALGPDGATYVVRRSDHGEKSIDVQVQKQPGSDGPWVVTAVSPDPNEGMPVSWLSGGWSELTSPVEVRVMGAITRYRVAILEPSGDGGYDVLGEVSGESPPPDDMAVDVAFRRPRGGFGVVATYGLDERGEIEIAHLLPASLDGPWQPPLPERRPRPPRPAAYQVRGDRLVVVAIAGRGYQDPANSPANAIAAAAKGDGGGVVARRGAGRCAGRLEALASPAGPPRPLADVAGLPLSVAARDDRVAYTVRRCGGATELVALVGGAERVVDSGPIRSVSWHPTEDRLVYLRGEEVVVAEVHGSGRTVLPFDAEAVTWRPGDEPRLVAAERTPDGVVVVSRDPAGGDRRPITVPLPVDRVAGLAYDAGGHYLAVTTTAGGYAEVYEDTAMLFADSGWDSVSY